MIIIYYVFLYIRGFWEKVSHLSQDKNPGVFASVKESVTLAGQWLAPLTHICLIPRRKPYIYYPGIFFQTFPWSRILYFKPFFPTLPYFPHMRPQSPPMSLLGALQGLPMPFLCLPYSARKTARKRCLWKPAYLLMPNMGRRIASIFPWMPTGGAPAFTAWHIRYRAGFQWCGTGAAITAARRKKAGS